MSKHTSPPDDDDVAVAGGLRMEDLIRLMKILRKRKISLIDGLVQIGITTGYLSTDDLDAIRSCLSSWYAFQQDPETLKWSDI